MAALRRARRPVEVEMRTRPSLTRVMAREGRVQGERFPSLIGSSTRLSLCQLGALSEAHDVTPFSSSSPCRHLLFSSSLPTSLPNHVALPCIISSSPSSSSSSTSFAQFSQAFCSSLQSLVGGAETPIAFLRARVYHLTLVGTVATVPSTRARRPSWTCEGDPNQGEAA